MLRAQLPREDLHHFAQIVRRGVSGRSTQPVQNNIYLEATGNVLRMIATDLEFISVTADVPAAVEEEGAVTVPANLFVEVTGSLPEEQVSLAADEQDSLLLEAGRARYQIRGMSAEDFETLPPVDGAVELEIPQRVLHELISQTILAASRDETRPILTGVLFRIRPEGLEVAATDTYRLAIRRLDATEAQGLDQVEEERDAIVSARCLQEVLRVIDADSDEPATVALGETLVEFTAGPIKIASRLIEGQFPPYERVIPAEYERALLVSRDELQAALRRALVVAREDANRVVFRAAGEILTLTAESPDVGRVEEELPIELEGEGLEIAFNARYLLDALEAMKSDRVRMELSGPLNPGVIKGEGDESFLYIQMPMQIMIR